MMGGVSPLFAFEVLQRVTKLWWAFVQALVSIRVFIDAVYWRAVWW